MRISGNRRQHRRRLTIRLLMAVLAALLLLTGCQDVDRLLVRILPGGTTAGTTGSQADSPTESTASSVTDGTTDKTGGTTGLNGEKPPREPVVWTQEGIRFEVTLDKDAYRSGDIIQVWVTITNTTDQAVPWQAGSTSFGAAGSIGISVSLDGRQDFRLIEAGEAKMGDTAMLYGELKPGDSIETRAAFTTRYRLDGDTEKEAWSGWHQLAITFARGQEERLNPISMLHKIQITSNSSEALISAEKAVALARETSFYLEWQRLHRGESVVKQEDGAYWWNFAGTWEKISEELYKETLANESEPDGVANYADDRWTVEFLSKLGDAPNRLIVVIDAVSSELLETSTQDR